MDEKKNSKSQQNLWENGYKKSLKTEYRQNFITLYNR